MLKFSNDWLREKIASDPDVECEAGLTTETNPMSYSFSVSSATKFDAITQARAKFDEIVTSQPAHDADRKAALASIEAFVVVLMQPGETETVNISVSGSLSWQFEGSYNGASINISAYIAKAN